MLFEMLGRTHPQIGAVAQHRRWDQSPHAEDFAVLAANPQLRGVDHRALHGFLIDLVQRTEVVATDQIEGFASGHGLNVQAHPRPLPPSSPTVVLEMTPSTVAGSGSDCWMQY